MIKKNGKVWAEQIRARSFLLLLAVAGTVACYGQRRIAITIDDVPNIGMNPSLLLKRLDSLQIPIAIFINEGFMYRGGSLTENTRLLNAWIQNPGVTPGNHSFSHPSYSAVGLDSFTANITRGEQFTRLQSIRARKDLRYFRFPFNDLGKDSAAHEAIRIWLNQYSYTITPFTLEGEDWMFATIYDNYLQRGDLEGARRTASRYIAFTTELLDYLDKVLEAQYHRPISHIYLCHDNRLNADYFPRLVAELKSRHYAFITLDEAMKDKVYQQKDYYNGPAGFSWVYRWVKDPERRKVLMKGEPDNSAAQKEYEQLQKEKTK